MIASRKIDVPQNQQNPSVVKTRNNIVNKPKLLTANKSVILKP
jgi:hypothetical protein